MRGLFTLTVLGLGLASAAQAIVLWQVENTVSGTMVPVYRGQGSPFPQPKVAETAVVDDEAAKAAALRSQALVRARKLTAPNVALQLGSSGLQVKGVTNGVSGVRVLVGNSWVGLNETIPVVYGVNPQTLEALNTLRQYDPTAANTLQQKLYDTQQSLQRQGVQVKSVNIKNRQLTLQTPQGIRQIPLILEP